MVFVGVVGYCPPTRFDEELAREMIADAYGKIVATYCGRPIDVVSGLTNVGVLKIAYEEAVKRHWTTTGIACAKAAEHPLFPVDHKFIIGEEWGDESSVFLGSIDLIVRIGNGKQSLRETEEVKKRGLPVFEYDLPILV